MHKQTWFPPPTGVLKINTDAAFRETEKKGAWGFVIRDCDGQEVLA
jgi:ribonuclease HI